MSNDEKTTTDEYHPGDLVMRAWIMGSATELKSTTKDRSQNSDEIIKTAFDVMRRRYPLRHTGENILLGDCWKGFSLVRVNWLPYDMPYDMRQK